MKKLLIFLIALIGLGIQAQTVTLPTEKVYKDSVFYELKENYSFDGTWGVGNRSNGNTTFSVNVSQWNPHESDLDLILNNGGSVNECELVLKIPQSVIEIVMNETTLSDTLIIGNAGMESRKWNSWFLGTGSWLYNSYVYCLTKNHTGYILNGDEIKIILNLSGSVELMGQSDPEFIEAAE